MFTQRWISKAIVTIVTIATILAGLSACAQNSPTNNNTQSQAPIKIGYSVALTGQYSQDGKALQQGFQLWQDDINKRGGLLGRQVVLDGLDDASNAQQETTNYQKLIATDHVDLLFGPFSSLLTVPAAVVAHRYNYALLAPTGSAPSVYKKHFNNIFVVTLPAQNYLKTFAQFILALPQNMRPKTAAYATVDNPFTIPQVTVAEQQLSAGGIKTVYSSAPYPQTSTDMSGLAQQIINSKADIVVLGTSALPDSVSFIKTFKQQHFNPKALIATAGPDEGSQFLSAIGGASSAEGIFIPNPGWYPGVNNYQNAQFTQEYIAKYGGTADDISASTVEGYSAGQVLEQAVNKIHSIDNGKLIQELHSDTFNSLQGPIRFGQYGDNTIGVPFLFQWQNGKLIPVYPTAQAQQNPEFPKKPWP
jgi:branched-chain amino acid transport system substrate-binding protein